MAQIFKKYLESNSKMQVLVASSAQGAIRAADERSPDLVVLELAMPRHNGYAFLHEFRSYSDWKAIPVIVHSHLAKDEAAMAADWGRLGATRYFYKPNTSLKQLKRAVEGALGL